MKTPGALLLALSVLVPAAFASAGQEHPHESARSAEPGGHHGAASPHPHARAATPTMPGLSSAQVLSGPLPMFPAPPTSPFSAAPSTYAPHNGVSPFLQLRPSIVIGGYAFGPDTPSEPTTAMAGRADAPRIDPPVAAQPPDAQPPPDRQPPGAPPPDVPPSVAPNLAPVTLYVISGCYAGDRPPADGMLPAGCDVSKMRTIRIR